MSDFIITKATELNSQNRNNITSTQVDNENIISKIIDKHVSEVNKSTATENNDHVVSDEIVDKTIKPEMQDLELKRVDSNIYEPAKYLVLNVYKDGDGIRYQIVDIYAGRVRQKIVPSAKKNKIDPRVNATNLFLKCVLLMAFTMYLFSAVLVLYIIITPDVRLFLSDNVTFFIMFPLIVFFVLDFAFVCASLSRISPCNFCSLCITVLSLSTISGTISAHADSEVLLYVIVATSVSVLVASFLTCTKFDFKSYKLYIVMLGAAFITNFVMIITAASAQSRSALWCFVLVLITFIQVGLIVLQLQSILNRKTIKMKDDDYALGAFMLYASIFDIFVKLMECRMRS